MASSPVETADDLVVERDGSVIELRPDADRSSWLRRSGLLRTDGPALARLEANRRKIGGDWVHVYQRRLVLIDLVMVALAAAAAYAVRFGQGATPHETLLYSLSILVLPLVWVCITWIGRCYEARYLGVGSEEFQRIGLVGLIVLAAVASVSYGLMLELARGFVLLAVPLATILTLLGRYGARKWLHRQRHHGQFRQRVVAVGHAVAVENLVVQVRGADYHGMDVIAACVPAGQSGTGLADLGVPVVGDFTSVASAVRRLDADVVAVLPSPEFGGAALRQLGWALEDTRADLVVAPSVIEVVGPRIAIRPVCGLPLLHLDRPELTGVRRFGKAIFDRVIALAAVVMLSPVLLAISAAIKATSRGPVLFRQERIGRDGVPFTMWKFRSMVVDADSQVASLSDRTDAGNAMLFKMKSDPRVTKVGAVLRRYSLDELPQLVNVLLGDMSLVGPRPPLRREVDQYTHDVRRRLMVKPGVTGLWQISGRSDLDWDESVRLDLRYVENWSFAFDLMIVWRTVGAVFSSRGAY